MNTASTYSTVPQLHTYSTPDVALYLLAIGRMTIEVLGKPHLLRLYVQIMKLALPTLLDMAVAVREE
jgi:hypothetical protein